MIFMKIKAYIDRTGFTRVITDCQCASELAAKYVINKSVDGVYEIVCTSNGSADWMVGVRLDDECDDKLTVFAVRKLSPSLMRWLAVIDMEPNAPAAQSTGNFAWMDEETSSKLLNRFMEETTKMCSAATSQLVEQFVKQLEIKDSRIIALKIQIDSLEAAMSSQSAASKVEEATVTFDEMVTELDKLYVRFPDLKLAMMSLSDLPSMSNAVPREELALQIRSLCSRILVALNSIANEF